MMDAAPRGLSRRNFLRGRFSDASPAASGWRLIDGLGAEPNDVFWDGWADASDVFIVGDHGAVLHFNGERWARREVPAPVPIHALWGLGCDNLWAVGWMGLILHHDGTHWRQVRGCVTDDAGKYSTDPINTPLFSIAGLMDGQAWAVGDHGTVLHYDGENWQAEASSTRLHLRCVTVLPDGRVLAAGGDGTVLIRSMAGVWERQACPVHSNYVAALPLGDGGVLLAGGRYIVGANGFRGDLVLWDGKEFRQLFADRVFSRFRAAATYQDDVLLVGDAGQMHVLRNGRIDRIDSGTTHDLLGLANLPTGEVLAVGDFGTALAAGAHTLQSYAPYVAGKEDVPVWKHEQSGTDRQLWGLWHDETRAELFACGEEGTVLVRDRGQWEVLPPVGDLGIHALNRATDGGLLAAGQMGEIHHFDGATWRKAFDLHMDVTILSLWSDGITHFAAGDEGLILSHGPNTADWTRMPSGTKSALYGLWGLDDSHLLAVGDFGLVQRWNGKRWDEFNAGTDYFLFGVWGRALDDIYVVGLSGTIGHFDGRRWKITPARARADLLAVTGDENQVIAVGAAGTVYRHYGRGWMPESSGTQAGLRAVATVPGGGFAVAGDRGSLLLRQPLNESIYPSRMDFPV